MQALTLGIPDAIEGYARYMRAKRKRERSITRFRDTLEKAAAALEWKSVDDIALAPVIDWLAGKVSTGAWSGTTHDTHVSALRGFGKFLHRAGHLPVDPLEHLERSNETGDPGSRAMSLEEVKAVLKYSHDRCKHDRRAKGNAALFWCFLAHTGLRHNEGSAVKWKDLDLERACLITDPQWSKNRRRQPVPLHQELLALLTAYRPTVKNTPESKVFPFCPNRNTWAKDRDGGGVSYLDQRGRAATIHSLRKYLDTQLDAMKVAVGVRHRIIRHYGGLDDRYLDHPHSDDVAAIAALPCLWPEPVCGKPVDENKLNPPPKVPHLHPGEQPNKMSNSHASAETVDTMQATQNNPVESPALRSVSALGVRADASAASGQAIPLDGVGVQHSHDSSGNSDRFLRSEMGRWVPESRTQSEADSPKSDRRLLIEALADQSSSLRALVPGRGA